jgi:cellulose synthase/poly-beta-1,6-N-acetylglucosamine synthase-like glycosyltransferase
MAQNTVSAYVPCYNERTILAAVHSILNQTAPPDEVFVIDDGSTNCLTDQNDVRVVRLDTNQGRGAARARAMLEANCEFVLGCDASLVLDRNFLANALPRFEEPSVAAVFGWIKEAGAASVANRWRGRHLYHSELQRFVSRELLLASGCFVVRRSAVENVGGFNAALRSGEDADLGLRLRGAGYNVVFDPNLFAYSAADNTVWEVLERYARWNTPEGMGIRNYLRQINYALKVMAVADLKAGDIPAACISLLCPHYQFWTRR